jgi:uncharacterized membrane protein (DUF106 family)
MFEPILKAVDIIFSSVTVFSPHIAILIVSISLTLLIFGLNRLIINRKLVRELKEKMEKARSEFNQAQKEGDKEKINKTLSEIMNLNKAYMKQTFKSLIISIIIVVIFLPWVKYRYGDVAIAIPFSLPFIGSSLSWLMWYVLVSFTIGWIVQKLLDYY